MKISDLNERMRDYNRSVAYGSECAAWGDYVADLADNYGDDETGYVMGDFRDYWIDVANGESGDYDAATGAYLW